MNNYSFFMQNIVLFSQKWAETAGFHAGKLRRKTLIFRTACMCHAIGSECQICAFHPL